MFTVDVKQYNKYNMVTKLTCIVVCVYISSLTQFAYFLSLFELVSLFSTMAQMAHFSFPYYFTIPNSEICTTNFGIRNYEVYIIWASDNSQSTLEGILNSQAKTKGSTT